MYQNVRLEISDKLNLRLFNSSHQLRTTEKEKPYSSIRLPRAAIFIILKSGKFFFLHKHACPLQYLILFIRSSSSRLLSGKFLFFLIRQNARLPVFIRQKYWAFSPAAVPPRTSLLQSLNCTIRYSQVYRSFSCPL